MDKPTIEQLVESHEKAKSIIEEAEAQQAVVKDAILEYLREKRMDGVKTKTGYIVRKVVMEKYDKVPLSFAREMGAIQTIEKIDTGKLRILAKTGIPVEGVQTITYVKISEAEGR